MILLARKKTSTEAGWIVFAVIFSTFSSALIIFLCWWNTRGSSKKSSTQQQQSASSNSRTRSRRSVRYWYYYPEYFGYNNGSSESSEDHDASTATDYHLEQTPNYYIYPPPYPPCPDPPPPPPRPPRTPPHIAVYRTRPVNVMSFLDRTQRVREPPPVAEVTSPGGTSTPPPGDGSSSSSDSLPDEPAPDGDGPPPSAPSGGPRPDGSAPGSPDANPASVHSPKEEGSVISRQDVSEAQANFSRLMSVADSHIQHLASASEAGSHRQSSARHTPSVRYVKAWSKGSSKERRGSKVLSPHGGSPALSIRESPNPAPGNITPKPNSHASRQSSRPSIHSHPSSKLLSPSPPSSRAPSHRSLPASRSRRSSPPRSPTPPHHSQSRYIHSHSHSHFDGRPTSRQSSRSGSRVFSSRSSPPQSPTPPHHSPIPYSPSRHSRSNSYGRPTSRHSSRSGPRSRVSSMPPSPTVTDFASISSISHPPGSPRRSSVSPAYRSGGFRAALSPQQEEQHELKGSRRSSRYSRHSKSPSAVSVSVVELLSLEKDLDQDDQGKGEPMSLLGHDELEEHEEEHEERRGSEVLVQYEDEVPRSRRSVSRDSQQRRRMDLADDERKSVEMEHRHHDHHDEHDPESATLKPEPEHVPEDYYRSYSTAANLDPLPPSPNLSGHSSNLSPKSPYHPRKYIPIQVPKENRPHQASVCSISDSTDSGIGSRKGGG
ncbi:hypothetical protein B0H65DRAFT_435602 [Neurospora tetraspora]|uniref:Uncharacterized protein n=1 Tax=Neurospora tetraspora TaxID=94610 RepID=A0AAE0MM93_9PEZI|nr:hypothetical protein B0H65DRAFT_435602 [Neurospora tetraspora]